MADIIKSYLVSLSATTDKASFDKFQSALGGTEKAVSSSVGSMAGKLLAFEVAGVSAFATVGFGLIGYIDKLAMADAATKRNAQLNMMSVQQYRGLQNTLKALNLDLNNMWQWTPEDFRRFHDMSDHIAKLESLAGGKGYEDQMVQVRRVIDQMSMLEADAQYFGMKFVSEVLTKLGFGSDGILPELERLNAFVLQNMPQWSDELSTDVIPVLKDFWGIMKDLGGMAAFLANTFVNLEGSITGNSSLDSKTTSFHQFATAVGDAAHQLAQLLKIGIDLTKIGINLGVGTARAAIDFAKGGQFGVGASIGADTALQHNVGGAWQSTKDLWRILAGHSSYDGGGRTSPSGSNADSGSPTQTLSRYLDSQGVSPALLDSIMRVESHGNVNAVSGKGALGPYQIMPANARAAGIDPTNMDQARGYAKKALDSSLAHYGGNLDLAVASYNFGQDRLDSYIKTGRYTKTSGGIGTQLPQETIDYVKKVTGDTLVVNVRVDNMHSTTPDHVAAAAKRGAQEALNDYHRDMITTTNGAYAQ